MRDLFFVGGFELDTQAVGQAVGERKVASDLMMSRIALSLKPWSRRATTSDSLISDGPSVSFSVYSNICRSASDSAASRQSVVSFSTNASSFVSLRSPAP